MRFLSDTKLIGGPVPGRSASVNVGSTSTGLPGSAASVSNSGSSNAAVLNFTIPSGVVGPQGAPGTPGSVTVAGLGDATTISRRVVTTATGGSGVANGANTWAKLVALSPGVNGSSHLLLGISTGVSYQPQSAIISVYAYQGSPSPAVPTVAVQIIGMPNSGPAFLQDGFKLVNNGHLAPVELWIKKSDQYTSFNVTEISRSTAAASVTYNDGAAWQAAEPVGSALNTRSTGVTVGGVPVVTTTGAQSLTNKTLTSPRMSTILDANGATHLVIAAGTTPTNYLQINNSSQGPTVSTMGASADIHLELITKGTGQVRANFVPVVTTSGAQALTNKTITAPTITSPNFDGGSSNANCNVTSTAADASMYFNAKGTGGHAFRNGSSNLSAVFLANAGAVNYLTTNGTATGTAPYLIASGSDANISLGLYSKGTGVVQANGNPVGVRVAVPASNDAPGAVGQWSSSADNAWLYICTAPSTWRRTALTSW